MSTTVNDLQGMVRGMHHVGLPSARKDWDEIAAFWRTLGLRCETHEVERDDYDHAGAGPRLQVMSSGYQLLVSHLPVQEGWLVRFLLQRYIQRFFLRHYAQRMHVGVEVDAEMLPALREHPRFERETHWGNALVSVFLTGPYGLHVECVTRNTAYHRGEL